MGPGNCTRATGKCCHLLIVFTVTYEYSEVSLKLAHSVSSASVCYAMAFEASLMLTILRGSLVVAVKSLETCRLETETMLTVSKSLETVLETNTAFVSC